MMNGESFKRLEGKVAIVTGGASGFGESTVRLFAKHGAKVVIADIQENLGIKLCKELVSKSSEVIYIYCDVSKDSDVKNVVDTAVSKFGKLDIMFSNAGIPGNYLDASIVDFDPKNFKRVFDVNVLGSFLVAKHAARVMIPTRSGVILFTSSLSSVLAGVAPHVYTVSKLAVVGLMKNLCVELGQHGIRVNSISPTYVTTPILTNAFVSLDKTMLEDVMCASSTLKGVVPTTEDIAEAALYLGSSESKFVSGINLVVDGGYSTTNQYYLMKMQEKIGSLKSLKKNLNMMFSE